MPMIDEHGTPLPSMPATPEEIEKMQADLKAKDLSRNMAKWQALLPHNDRLTEGEQADLFNGYLRKQGLSFRHCPAYGWMQFVPIGSCGGKWVRDAEKKLQTAYTDFIKEQLSSINSLLLNTNSADDNRRKELQHILSFIIRMDARRSVDNVLSLLKGKESLNVNAEQFDTDAYTINTPSGIVDLKTGDMRPATPEDFCTHITGADLPMNDDGADLWHEFLLKVTCEDPELMEYLKLCAGMFLYGKVKDDKLYIALGNGGNGKSTLFNTLSAVMGDYATSGNASMLVDETGQHKNFELAKLQGKRLLVLAELAEGKRLNESILKQIASTDRIHAEHKYGMPFDYWPSHTPVLYTNNMPAITATDEGTWRRIAIIPFDYSFTLDMPDNERIMDFASVLTEKAGGCILMWMIEGAVELYKKAFKIPVPSRVRNKVNSFRQTSDTVLQFMGACDFSDEQARTKRPDLYSAYQSFCERMGVQNPARKSDFFRRIEAEGYECRANGGYYWYYGIQPPQIDADADTSK